MTTELRLPELGENVDYGVVAKVLVSVGDTIILDQPVLELETDKAVIEVPSTVTGTVKEIHLKPGDEVTVGELVLTVDGAVGVVAFEKKEAVKAASPDPPSIETSPSPIVAPPPVDEEYFEPPLPKPSPLTSAAAPSRRVLEAVPLTPPAKPIGPPAPAPAPGAQQAAPAAPSVRRLARELGVDINQVAGSGPEGLITLEDVKEHARLLISGTIKPFPVDAARSAHADVTGWGVTVREPMSTVRRRTAENMAYAWATVPHVTQFDKADITELEQLRKRFSEKAEMAGGKLTVTAIILKVLASALKVFPQFNASLDMEKGEVVFKKYYNIGVAVDTDRGLLVPVVRDADKKNIVELSVELNQLAEKARTKRISVDELQGGTFTITNLGGIGGTSFSPIVFAPQVAILGISRAKMEPVWMNGQFEPRMMLPLSLSYDHRLIDGADAIRFLRWIVEALQQPFLLALEG
jgi:pyruvate dehydrogenase E2 component (dihydrolipoamide acetyltransferase)